MKGRALSASLLALACGCSLVTPPRAEPLPPESAGAAHVGVRIEGVVITRWGYVVPDAWVTVRVGSPHTEGAAEGDCEGASHLPTRTRSAPTGEFGVVIDAGPRAPFLACLEIEALPPRRLGLRENSTVVPSVAFTRAGATGGGDVVQVRVVLY